MTFAISGPLQMAVFTALGDDPALAALVGTQIYDATPAGTLPETYVRLGSETVTDASDGSGGGAIHKINISVFTTSPGFSIAKTVAGTISDLLQDANLPLARGHLVNIGFERAVAKRVDGGATRQIDMRFRARVQDD